MVRSILSEAKRFPAVVYMFIRTCRYLYIYSGIPRGLSVPPFKIQITESFLIEKVVRNFLRIVRYMV